MLILAGVSLNAVIGENGIITQAQNAKIATAVGSFNEYMQSWFFNKKMEDDGYNIEDLYVSAGWLERKLDIDDEGNAYYVYIIDKSKVTDEEILKYMQAGDGDPYSLQDVYGINSDFSIWYKDSFGNLINSQIKVLAIDDNTEVNFVDPALSQAIANAVGVDKDNVTIGDLKNVTTLKLNYDGTESDITNLNDLYYLPNLKNLYIYNLDLDNIDGLKYCSNLDRLEVRYCTITSQLNSIQYCSKLRYIVFGGNPTTNKHSINNNNIDSLFNAIKNMNGIVQLLITNMEDSLTNLEKINNGLQSLNCKGTLSYLALSNNDISEGELNLNGFNSLYQLALNDFKGITRILGLENMKLRYFDAQATNLIYIDNINMDYTRYTDTFIYLKNCNNLNPTSISAASEQLLNVYKYTINPEFAQYIVGNTTLDYSSIPSEDLVDGTITYVPDTVTTVNLTNKSKITNINFLKNKTNIKELNLSNCTGISEENLIEVLSTLTGIEILTLQGLYQLTDITFINNMPKLYDFTLLNTSVEFTIATDANAIALNNSNITRLQIGYNGNDESKYKGNNIDLTLIQPCINKLTYSNGLVLRGNSKANEKFAEQLSRCTQLTQLTMRYYQLNIKKLDLSALTKLETLYLSQIYIDELDISGCINLKKLYLDGMFNGNYKFNKPDFSNLSQLETLSYTNNFMTSSEFNDMCDELANSKNLQTINLSYNSISNISNIGKLSRFTTNSLSLTMTNNNLSDISPIINCSRISVLNLKYNNLGNDTLDYLVQLYNENKKLGKSALYLGGNNITDYSPLLNLGFYEGNLTLP